MSALTLIHHNAHRVDVEGTRKVIDAALGAVQEFRLARLTGGADG